MSPPTICAFTCVLSLSPFTVRSLGVKTVRLPVPGKGGFMMCINVELSFKGEEAGKGYVTICFKLLLENAGEQIDRKVDLLLQTASSFEQYREIVTVQGKSC